MKKLLKLMALFQAARHGHGAYANKPWKGKKWKGDKHRAYGPHGYPPYGHGPTSHPYGYGRPRGLKGMLVEAVVRRLFGR